MADYSNTCGVRWAPENSDGSEDCPYGLSEEHVCFNLKDDCDGAHMCCCESQPSYVSAWIRDHPELSREDEDTPRDMLREALWYLYTEDYEVVCAHCGKVYGSIDKEIN